MPRVSVIIPTYNCSEFIKDAINSILKQTYSDHEIIVVDDGSTDSTRKLLDTYIRNGLVNYIYQENKGHSFARNAGIKAARGGFIAFLDADDIWLPDKLELQMKIFDTDSSIGLIHSDINVLTDRGEMVMALRRDFPGEIVQRHSGNIFDAFFCREIYISCATVIVKKECFDRVGLFDEKLARLCFEDSEMWLRIVRHYKAHYIHKPLAIYRIRPNSMSKNRQKMIEAHRYVVEKLSRQYNLSAELKNKAVKAMLREWGLGEYRILNGIRDLAKNVKKRCERWVRVESLAGS